MPQREPLFRAFSVAIWAHALLLPLLLLAALPKLMLSIRYAPLCRRAAVLVEFSLALHGICPSSLVHS